MSSAASPELDAPYRAQYHSEEWHELDLERIWHKRWLFVGHDSQIPEPGDYTTYRLPGAEKLGSVEVVISRTGDGGLAAFHNVCRHRGARICEAASGHVKKNFVCRYHGWSYGLDGELKTAPKMGADFDKSAWPAKRVWVESWNGMIFINLQPERPATVAEMLASADLSRYMLDKTKVVADAEFEFECNWKMVAENFAECYHCAMNHPELCRVLIPDANLDVIETLEREDPTELLMFAADATESFLPGVESMTADGKYAVSRLLGDPADPPTTTTQLSWFPNFQLNGQPDWFLTESWRPLGPSRAVFRATWILHEEAVEGVDYELENVTAMHMATLTQDQALMNDVVVPGTRTVAFENGPLSAGLEVGVKEFWETYFASIERG